MFSLCAGPAEANFVQLNGLLRWWVGGRAGRYERTESLTGGVTNRRNPVKLSRLSHAPTHTKFSCRELFFSKQSSSGHEEENTDMADTDRLKLTTDVISSFHNSCYYLDSTILTMSNHLVTHCQGNISNDHYNRTVQYSNDNNKHNIYCHHKENTVVLQRCSSAQKLFLWLPLEERLSISTRSEKSYHPWFSPCVFPLAL